MPLKSTKLDNLNRGSNKDLRNTTLPASLEVVSVNELEPNARNARTHSKKQVKQIVESIRQFGFNNPILIDNAFSVIAGHGRLQAAKLLGLTDVSVVCLSHLSDAEKRAYILADNKIALNAGWDSELLALELGELIDLLPEIDLGLEVTGFEMGEIDIILSDHEPPAPCDEDDVPAVRNIVVTQRGDIWQLGHHRIQCADARDNNAMPELFSDQVASLVLTDPPYNVKVQGHVGGRGKTKHSEFAFASGEMSDQEFKDFLNAGMSNMLTHLTGGALLYLFMDWRHIEILLSVGRELELALKNICVWNKTTPGQGSFYRCLAPIFSATDFRFL